MTLEINGLCPERFAPVRAAFEANFAVAEEIGARFTACVEGEVVVDLYAGSADRAGTRPFAEDTLTPVFSTTKAVGALMIAWAVDRGLLDYEQTVASLWPEFAQGGKDQITVAQVLSHQAGLSGFAEPIEPALWFDPAGIAAAAAAAAPLWAPGSASGYSPTLWGVIAGELFRRADGRTLGQTLREELAEPFGLDLWIGVPAGEDGRVAELRKPAGASDFGERNEATTAAFLRPWSSPRAGGEGWVRLENPALTGHATAAALARLMAVMANGGRLDGRAVLSPSTIAEASRERITGFDLVLPFEISWAAGFMRGGPNRFFGPNPEAFGHYGWGGSCAMADPERRVSAAYVMNRQSTALVGEPRALRLIGALYEAL